MGCFSGGVTVSRKTIGNGDGGGEPTQRGHDDTPVTPTAWPVFCFFLKKISANNDLYDIIAG